MICLHQLIKNYNFKYKIKNFTKNNLLFSYLKQCQSPSAFSMFTYLGPIGEAIWSNSPESLFQLRNNDEKNYRLQTLPIKGTVPLEDYSSKAEAWRVLKSSVKNQAELYMIIDLLRNDFNKIDLPNAKVVHKKVPLLVPGLIHQMSRIEIDVSKDISFERIFNSLFPGGSITGAPKKSVMKILRNLESRSRGVYCGSTILASGGKVDTSINIRTAQIDLKGRELTYGAGGGITVLSELKEEYKEMQDKVNSFLEPLRC